MKMPEDSTYFTFELAQYIEAFRTSADRTRYVVYVSTFVNVLILVALWNYYPVSWSRQGSQSHLALQRRQREIAWLDEHIGTAPYPEKRSAQHSAPVDVATHAAEDADLFAAQADIFNHSMRYVAIPGLGTVIHINDIGITAGAVLLVLTLLLCYCVVREHENLHLAAYKIFQLCEWDSNASDGESAANLLYHAIAMGQVLHHPPTLARWQNSVHLKVLNSITWSIFLLPAITQASIVIPNLFTLDRAFPMWGYQTVMERISVQLILGLLILLLATITIRYSRATDRQWRKAFFVINAGLAHVQQRPWSEWLHISSRKSAREDSGIRLIMRDLTYRLRKTPDAQRWIALQATNVAPTPDAKDAAEQQDRLSKRKQKSAPEITQGDLHIAARGLRKTMHDVVRIYAATHPDLSGARLSRLRIRSCDVDIDDGVPTRWRATVDYRIEFAERRPVQTTSHIDVKVTGLGNRLLSRWRARHSKSESPKK